MGESLVTLALTATQGVTQVLPLTQASTTSTNLAAFGISGSFEPSLESSPSKKRKVQYDLPTVSTASSADEGQLQLTAHPRPILPNNARLLEIAQLLQHPMSSLARNSLQDELERLNEGDRQAGDTYRGDNQDDDDPPDFDDLIESLN